MIILNKEYLKQKYETLVGWEQHYDITQVQITDANLLISDSGNIIQHSNPACDLSYINSAKPLNVSIDEYLSSIRKSAIQSLLTRIEFSSNEKFNFPHQKYDNVNKQSPFEAPKLKTPSGRFVGMYFSSANDNNLVLQLKRIALHFNKTFDLDIYFYTTNSTNPVTVKNLHVNENIKEWHDVSELFPKFYNNEINDHNFLIGYYESDLPTGTEAYNWTSESCYFSRKSESFFYQFNSFFVPSDKVDNLTKTLMINKDLKITNDTFGMDFDYNIRFDASRYIEMNEGHFANLITKKIVLQIMNRIRYSNIKNFENDDILPNIFTDIFGDKSHQRNSYSMIFEKNVEAFAEKMKSYADNVFKNKMVLEISTKII